MALQSRNLVMVGLGVLHDDPPRRSDQPPLIDGIHLRWAFKADIGFPWYGYYLFRRLHRSGMRECIADFTGNLSPGIWNSSVLSFPHGSIQSDRPLTLTDDFPPIGSVEFDLEDRNGLTVALNEPVHLIVAHVGFRENARIQLTAFWGTARVAHDIIEGTAGDIVALTIECDAITSVKIGDGPATLVDLCFARVSQDARGGWELVPGFDYPLCLPVFHPDYPGTVAIAEDLLAARAVARGRVLYGDPAQLFSPPKMLDDIGACSVSTGSPIVTGGGTNWNESLVGGVFRIQGDPTAYTIINIIDRQKLVLSRAYGGPSAQNQSYHIHQDPFGGLHDTLVHIVAGGSTAVTNMSQKAIMDVAYQTGTVVIGIDCRTVQGIGTNWAERLAGLDLCIEGESETYTISRVDSPTILSLDRNYNAPPQDWLNPIKTSRPYAIYAPMGQKGSGKAMPRMPVPRALDMVLLGALNPAMAQMLGLYWADREAVIDTAYDYIILADHKGRFHGDPQTALRYLSESKLLDVDGFIVYNIKVEQAAKLEPPDRLNVNSLPGGFIPVTGKPPLDAQNNAGLRWDLGRLEGTGLLSGKAVMYHVWRGSHGEQEPILENVLLAEQYQRVTEDNPVLVGVVESSSSPKPDPPADWPQFPLHFVDRALKDGWYSFRVSGIDIFGRHSEQSSPAEWRQWAPEPVPRPWYYRGNAGDAVVHSFAICLLDKIPPPAPTGVEAYALDPADPTLLKDLVYKSWLGSLPPNEAASRIGLRVRWLWTPAQAQQAYDTSEFRIYCQPGRLNALLGDTVAVKVIDYTTSFVQTTIPNKSSADAYRGATLQIGTDSFVIIGSEAGDPLRLRVKTDVIYKDAQVSIETGSSTVRGTGTNWGKRLTGAQLQIDGDKTDFTVLEVDSASQELTLNRCYHSATVIQKASVITGRKQPRAGVPCTVSVIAYALGRVSVTKGSTTVTGSDTDWSEDLAGKAMRILGSANAYTIASINTDNSLTIDQPYNGETANNKTYNIVPHPLSVDYTVAKNWSKRIFVVKYDEHVEEIIRPVQDPSGTEMIGNKATVAGKVVTLGDDFGYKPDLSGMLGEANSLPPVQLYLENDTIRTSKIYSILAVDNNAKTVTVDGVPLLNGLPSRWWIGVRVRKYEVFLPQPGALTDWYDKYFVPDLADPIVYAHIGVSTVDDKKHTPDDPKWAASTWGDRYGNEGPVLQPVGVVRVLRDHPAAPVPPPDSEKVFASKADYHNHSYYTYRWKPVKHLKTHIFRALNDTLFNVDWGRRPRKPLDPNNADDLKRYPSEQLEPRWDAEKRQQVADDLNTLNGFAKAAKDVAMSYYHQLSNDALRVLAGLAGSEQAFSQITIQPLDPEEPDPETLNILRWRNRRGPDNPDDLVIDPALRAFIDRLDGRATNYYFYRSAYVDGAQNLSALSLSSPPVWLPDAIPPRAPVITKALGGDRKVSLEWQPNREPGMNRYLIYRTTDPANSHDVRRMGNPAGAVMHPIFTFEDTNLVGPLTYYYRLVAIRQGQIGPMASDYLDIFSLPSTAVAVRNFSSTPPVPPVWVRAEWALLDADENEVPWGSVAPPGVTYVSAVMLEWNSQVPYSRWLVERRIQNSERWRAISPWLDASAGASKLRDLSASIDMKYVYRVRGEDIAGSVNMDFNEKTMVKP